MQNLRQPVLFLGLNLGVAEECKSDTHSMTMRYFIPSTFGEQFLKLAPGCYEQVLLYYRTGNVEAKMASPVKTTTVKTDWANA